MDNDVQLRSAPPQSWAELSELLLSYDEETKNMFERFGAAARKLMFGDEGLSPSDRDALWQVSVSAALALLQSIDTAKFPPPSENEMRAAWASAMDGRELEPVPKKEVPDAP